ncbi:flagellar motor protein MotB [Campylobacter novaezeelandiae]|uniref:Flagellar motor protein MotB n=1 Tax=Campylobacter novaezeelandiae TaxID=2267891 RepID=A0A4Q9JV29_9BACT|nr:flagellar motor protein MotB [Campylobacter novaezeelandiae]MBK1963900.1 flagellar motor protein MotB [Campylobacter novaezeelandiae]MBK1993070.1 flagellar motor protein MotB [Campylobacter novaezeelandiae]QWU80638.1 flagellar motor stator protein [Campylobacter novaezeelandiae]TBR78351.1 flagellar motor protein MotB [Campylobacter novaezeelandiae]TBR79690.1 flagellar motor protein MotB [Campylobacter novaezeelandiae]
MAKKHKCPECPAGEKWAVPYADFLSLLLALFIALWAISKSNPAKVEALKTEFIKIFDYTTTQTIQEESKNQEKYKGPAKTESDEIEALKQRVTTQQDTIKKLQAALDQSNNEVALNLPSKILFQKGSAEIISADIKDYLKRMAQLALNLPPQTKIEIRGYTDNSDTVLRSFELGYERAQNVLKYFIDGGVNIKNLSIKSYGFNEPLQNNPTTLNNNRVEIYFKVDSDNEAAQKSILELIHKPN